MEKNPHEIYDALRQPIDVTRVKKRAGGGGNQLSYVETHDVISSLNEIFGFNKWNFALLNFESFATPKGTVYRQTVALSVTFGGSVIIRQDVGIGIAVNGNSDQIEKGMKEAASDGLKRCARTLGDQFGNSLYEKDAPEHHGQQREAIATSEELHECEVLRNQAIALGFNIEGRLPKEQVEGAERRRVLSKTSGYRNYIVEHGDKGGVDTAQPDVEVTD